MIKTSHGPHRIFTRSPVHDSILNYCSVSDDNFTRQRTLSESLQHCQTCSISIKSYSMCSRRLIPLGVSEFPYAIMSYLSIHGMHSNDLDTFGLQIRFSRLHAFVQFTNYLPIKTTGLCNCTWKKKERRGGVCDM